MHALNTRVLAAQQTQNVAIAAALQAISVDDRVTARGHIQELDLATADSQAAIYNLREAMQKLVAKTMLEKAAAAHEEVTAALAEVTNMIASGTHMRWAHDEAVDAMWKANEARAAMKNDKDALAVAALESLNDVTAKLEVAAAELWRKMQ